MTRFIHQKYDNDHLPTIGVVLETQQVILDNVSLKVRIFDGNCDQRQLILRIAYLARTANAFILVYDATDSKSLTEIKQWHQIVTNHYCHDGYIPHNIIWKQMR